jgi:hypothetical protein
VVEDLPAGAVARPDGGAAGFAAVLVEVVGEEKGVCGEREQMEVGAEPAGGSGVGGWIGGEVLKDEGAVVAFAGGANLPVVGGHEAGEVFEGAREVRAMEDGLAGGEGVEDVVYVHGRLS